MISVTLGSILWATYKIDVARFQWHLLLNVLVSESVFSRPQWLHNRNSSKLHFYTEITKIWCHEHILTANGDSDVQCIQKPLHFFILCCSLTLQSFKFIQVSHEFYFYFEYAGCPALNRCISEIVTTVFFWKVMLVTPECAWSEEGTLLQWKFPKAQWPP